MSAITSTKTCKLVLVRRCMRAMLLSVAVQFLLLTVFLLFVNFQLFHPLSWMISTIQIICSFYTWFGSIPLTGAVVLYGLSLCQQHLVERRYCPTRYRWLLHNGLRKLMFLGAHLMVGYLTAWLYSGYLHTDYRNFFYKCYGHDCLSSYHLYLLGMGTAAGCYYFVIAHMRSEVTIDFSIVEQSPAEKLRELFYDTLLKMPLAALVPTVIYSLVYWLFASLVKHKVSLLFGVQTDERLVGIFELLTSGRLLFYAWLLTMQIMSNMYLMQRFYATLLAEDLQLVIVRSRAAFANEREVALVSALGISNVYVVQCLAAHSFYKIAHSDDPTTRLEVFQLTEPGNRPAGWRALCDQCLSIISGFTDELIDSMRNLNITKSAQTVTPPQNDANDNLAAEKLLLRQYNKLHGIRPIVSPLRKSPVQQLNTPLTAHVQHVPNWCARFSRQLEASLQRLLLRIPGLVYMFGEATDAKTTFLLDNSLPMVWITQAMSQLCVSSVKEDRFGIVQSDLPAIVKALHNLKSELDKLCNAMTNTRHKNPNFNLLRCAVRRSLYNVCSSFYLGDLVPPGEELQQLQSFLYQE